MPHRNAPLTETGRLRWPAASSRTAGRCGGPRNGSRSRHTARTLGRPLPRPRRGRHGRPLQPARTTARDRTRRAANGGSSSCGSPAAGDRPASPASCGMRRLHRRTRSCAATGWPAWPTWTGPPASIRRVVRRYERDRPGELVHVDIKKLGQHPRRRRPQASSAGQRRRNSRDTTHDSAPPGIGYSYLHTAVDDHSRLAYTEILADERATPPPGSGPAPQAWFAAHGITDRTGAHRQRRLLPLPRLAPPPWPPPASCTSAPGPTGPRPTARSNGSTAPCSTNGPTSGPTPPKARTRALPAGSTTTTITAPHRPRRNPPASRVPNLSGQYT